MAQEMPDWSELQRDVLFLIGRCLNQIKDYLNFGRVCKSWHSVANTSILKIDLPRVPWLMLAEEEDDEGNSFREFFSLSNGTIILEKRIPKASRKRCMESMGWLITVGEDEGEISLLHPFSGVQIELPHQNTTLDYDDHVTGWLMTFIRKAVLSASPSHTSDYILMVIEGGMRFLSFWTPGDLRWTRAIWEGNNHNLLADLVYFNGHIYAVNYLGELLVCDVADVVGPEPTKGHIVAKIPFEPLEYREHFYIVESLGSLFLILRCGVQLRSIQGDWDRISLTVLPDERDEEGDEVEDDMTYGTTNFRVFQVDLAAGKVTETRELGESAFFVGANASLSVQASQFPELKPNHIYFTDDFFESYLSYEEGGGLDMGVFNLADGSIEYHYDGYSLSRFCPPIWVTPTPY